MKQIILSLIIVCLFTVVVFAGVNFNPDKLYQLGVEAYKQKQCNEVIKFLESALKHGLSGEKQVNAKRMLADCDIASNYEPRCVFGGWVFFDGKDISKITNVSPQFWIRNENTGKVEKPIIQYENGYLKLFKLFPGEYGISVNVDANKNNPIDYPGDYYSFDKFKVNDFGKTTVVINLKKLIHLKEPQNNNEIMKKWGVHWEKKILLKNPVKFSWASLGKNVQYVYSVTKMSAETYRVIEKIIEDTTAENSILLKLEPSKAAEYYSFKIFAQKEGHWLGMLMTHGNNGHGWDYRFRVSKKIISDVKLIQELTETLNEFWDDALKGRYKQAERHLSITAKEQFAKQGESFEKIMTKFFDRYRIKSFEVSKEIIDTLEENKKELFIPCKMSFYDSKRNEERESVKQVKMVFENGDWKVEDPI